MGTIPFSNPAGNNQTNPVSSLMPKGAPAMPGGTVGSITTNNPYSPVHGAPLNGAAPAGGQIPSSASPTPIGSPSVPNVGGLTQSSANTTGTTGALTKQLTDIYGKGTGGALAALLEGMSGTDSATLQEYIASLQPVEAKAQANTDAALGAGGVSANSSVAAIADSNLQSQETAAIAGESANLTQSQEALTAQILSGTEGAAAKEVATSGWSIFGDVMNQITGDIGNLMGGSYSNSGSQGLAGGSTPGPSMSAPQLPSGLGGTAAPDASGLTDFSQAGLDMTPFS